MAELNFFKLGGLLGWRLTVCLLHLNVNVNIQDSNLWQNVKSVFGGSGWGRGNRGVWRGSASMRTWKVKQCEELCGGSRVLLGVSPI